MQQLGNTADNAKNAGYRTSAARLIRAEILRGTGETRAALDMLGVPTPLSTHVLPDVLQYPSAHERFLRAELFRALNNPREALRWYGTFPDPGAYDIMYRPAVLLGAAAAYEQLGRADSARTMYARGGALLSHADVEYAPMAVHARERIAVLR